MWKILYTLTFYRSWTDGEKNVPTGKEIHMQNHTPQNGVSEGFSF